MQIYGPSLSLIHLPVYNILKVKRVPYCHFLKIAHELLWVILPLSSAQHSHSGQPTDLTAMLLPAPSLTACCFFVWQDNAGSSFPLPSAFLKSYLSKNLVAGLTYLALGTLSQRKALLPSLFQARQTFVRTAGFITMLFFIMIFFSVGGCQWRWGRIEEKRLNSVGKCIALVWVQIPAYLGNVVI